MKKQVIILSSALFLLAACGGGSTESTETTTPTEETANVNENEIEVDINAGDDMKFDVTEITVKEGQTVKLTLNHTGKSPVTAMGHNFVLLAQGVDLTKFAEAAIAAKDTKYIPAGSENDIIAHTDMIGGGESTEIEFTAPAKGEYEFLCSFPGHSAMMKGKFIVE
jgi:azurin